MEKQINKKAIAMLDSYINDVLNKVISENTQKRITDKNLMLK